MATLYPSIHTLPRLQQPADGVYTNTLNEQRDTEEAIADVLDNRPPAEVPRESLTGATTVLRTPEHVKFLSDFLLELPAAYVSLDASKPWLMFWSLHSYDLMGVLLPQDIRNRAINTLLHYQSPTGGFSGGASNSHIPHLLPSYAAVASLAIVGHPGPGGGWERLASSRQEMYNFFMRCKRPDGSFLVSEGGEVDVRGTYCLLVVATLLDILTPELLHNVDKFIAACQTYEGGFACSSFHFDDGHRVAIAEAHGGYTSCSVFSHFLLSSVQPKEKLESLGESFPVPIDVDSAIRWGTLMQGEAGEAGGFRGRSNKLVDGCYSWWVGGTFPILEELHRRESPSANGADAKIVMVDSDGEDAGEWTDEPSMHALFNRVALQEYILLVAQKDEGGGGLRDKPGKRPDLYHTCNNLSGLSIAQHRLTHSPEEVEKRAAQFKEGKGLPAVKPTKPEGGWKSEEERQAARRQVWASVRGWVEDESAQLTVGGMMSRVNTTIPPFNLIDLRLNSFVDYFYGQ